MKLSKIEVTFERTKQVQQYEPAKASVTIGYVFDEDSDTNGEAVTAYALDLAKNRVAEALGLKTTVIQAKDTVPVVLEHKPGIVEAAKTEVNPTVAVVACGSQTAMAPATAPAILQEPVKKRGRPAGSKNKVDPAAMEDASSEVEPVSIRSAVADPAAMEDVSIPSTQIGTLTSSTASYTATDLARAISNRVTKMVQAKIANPSDKIKAYIETWRPPGVTGPVSAIYQHVPEALRAEFLAKLEDVA